MVGFLLRCVYRKLTAHRTQFLQEPSDGMTDLRHISETLQPILWKGSQCLSVRLEAPNSCKGLKRIQPTSDF